MISVHIGNSEGKYITFGIKERYDCISWCEFISNTFNYIDEIYLMGMSMGATTVLLASEFILPDKVKAIIADSGFTSPKDIVFKVSSSNYGIDLTILLPFINIYSMFIARFRINECTVLNAMKKNKLPILFIHALSDDFVPSKMSKINFEACHTRKNLVLVDCVNHGMACVQDEKAVLNELEKFLFYKKV